MQSTLRNFIVGTLVSVLACTTGFAAPNTHTAAAGTKDKMSMVHKTKAHKHAKAKKHTGKKHHNAKKAGTKKHNTKAKKHTGKKHHKAAKPAHNS